MCGPRSLGSDRCDVDKTNFLARSRALRRDTRACTDVAKYCICRRPARGSWMPTEKQRLRLSPPRSPSRGPISARRFIFSSAHPASIHISLTPVCLRLGARPLCQPRTLGGDDTLTLRQKRSRVSLRRLRGGSHGSHVRVPPAASMPMGAKRFSLRWTSNSCPQRSRARVEN